MKPFYHKHNIHKQYYGLLPNYIKVIDSLLPINYRIVIELTDKGNIHFHSQIHSLYKPSSFEMFYKLLTKDLGFSDIVHAQTDKQITGWIQYMSKDYKNTLKCFNKLLDFNNKDIPVKFRKIIIENGFLEKHIEINKKNSFEKIISQYLNICHTEKDTVNASHTNDEHQTTQSWDQLLS